MWGDKACRRPIFYISEKTVRAPLGYIVAGRSGDRASDCNCGFFVRNDDKWDWLRSFPSIGRIEEWLGPEEYRGKPIDRFQLPGISTEHFLLHDRLDCGYNACSNNDNAWEECDGVPASQDSRFAE